MIKKIKVLIIILPVFIFTACTQNHTKISNDSNIISKELPQEQKQEVIYENSITPAENIISPEALHYLGAFRLPADGSSEKNMFSWGGEAITYNQINNSLFIVGHNWHTNVAEISIPEPKITKDLSQLNQSEIIQSFKDIKRNNFNSWNMEIPRVGIEVIDDILFYCFGQHF